MAAAVTDHEQDLYDSRGSRRDRRVQVDHHAARTVGIDRIGTPFLPRRCELGWNAVAEVVALGEIALAVKNLDSCDDLRRISRSVRGNPESVFAFEGCV
jgi:hypothetical protein